MVSKAKENKFGPQEYGHVCVGRVVSLILLPTLILTCLATRGRVLTKALNLVEKFRLNSSPESGTMLSKIEATSLILGEGGHTHAHTPTDIRT